MDGRRSNRANRETTTQHTETETEGEPAVVWHPVWVAIYVGGGAFKHWSLFVEDEEDQDESFIVHVQGEPGTFRYQQIKKNARESRSLIEMIQVGHVKKNELRDFRRVCRDVIVS
ncbi:hypothetical protein ONS95_004798 [Cadophora gregata]|uniref:uncharacterized protein n=1 Tax=Cadophora gregata TaxID=51156 RepID=UPI0026DAC3BA|nr:uncharacterized protein ONS95_004798 [Cadophora gregata]KAK0104510.1 hypothetical protein ONS95_004798 [Cadophora gregata]KAK0115398.1 hypothetical protein ONS96_013854 [Cadophora gregata f. sp. sojae]